ncbi:MAG: BON domain-containing protein [Xanthomonadales bacterium]|nr:BON domain-containing protein [Xanthomonadales bacterium]
MSNNALIRMPSLAALVAAGALVVAAPMAIANDYAERADDRDSSQPVTDTWITTKVKSTLLADGDVAGTDINVTTVDGVVTLAGVLNSQAAVEKAIDLTRGIEGVVAVDTRALTVR